MVVTHDTHIRTIQKVSTVCAQVQQKYSPSICTCTAVLPHPLVALSRICETATNFFKLCLVIFKFTEWLTNSPVRDKNFFFMRQMLSRGNIINGRHGHKKDVHNTVLFTSFLFPCLRFIMLPTIHQLTCTLNFLSVKPSRH